MLRTTLLTAGVVAALSAPVSAALLTFETNLSGANEVPANGSTATGYIKITLDDVSGQVNVVTGSYAGLSGNITGAHIHGLALPTANAGVLIGLTHTGGTAGTLTGSGTLSAANVTGMKNGLTYVNVHSTVIPGGEIRGQLAQVPEPAMLGLVGTAGMLLLRRKPAAK